MASEFGEIQKLVQLFNPKTDNSDSEDEVETNQSGPSTLNPSHLAKPSLSGEEKNINPYSKIEEKGKRREILDPEDPDFAFEDDHTTRDWKKAPVWDVKYKQQVTAEDVFLQMGFKSPTTASCEDMIITIHLPEEKHQNIDLKIVKDRLTLISPRFYLDLPLPHPVDPKRGNAQWYKDQENLTVTLRMDRELDLVNF
ncbi:protein PIH1D3 [Anoplophora glabripennis]|uniref:protein PIH1D3 n=1 Tax=Anoplophora glabripennis TaxID=217634 RepID=UPI0008754825|nr:protein PIH1D3 [Anoplophora glabripennis]